MMAWVVPVIFLAVAAFLLQIVVARLVAAQREQIGTLKALGYGNVAIGAHYLQLVLVIVGAGVIAGTLLGFWIGAGLAQMYTATFFRLPYFVYEREASVILAAAAASVVAALAGVASALRYAMLLAPAEAMRPEPPARHRQTFIERWGLASRLPLPLRMVARSIGRRPVRALLSTIGLALGVSILVTGAFFNDALNALMKEEFDVVGRADATVTFTRPLSEGSAYELAQLPGVLAVEPFRSVPAQLRAGHRTYRTSVVGLQPDPALRRVVDPVRGPMTLPDRGVVITEKLASVLGVEPGERIVVEVLEGRRPRLVLEVAATVSEYLGLNAYMQSSALDRALGDGGAVSGAFLDLDGGGDEGLQGELRRRPNVAGVTLRTSTIAAFQRSMGEMLLVFTGALVLFAVIISAGVIYNSGRISLAERQRDLATLRVLGLTRGEVALVFLGELAVQLLAALPLGVAIGYALAFGTAQAMSTELFRIPFVASRGTVAFTVGVTLGTAGVVAAVLRRRIDRLEMVEVLKARE
jgi:putative ABC transport system permease protein